MPSECRGGPLRPPVRRQGCGWNARTRNAQLRTQNSERRTLWRTTASIRSVGSIAAEAHPGRKKGGRGGSFPSPKGEEDPVEGCSDVVVRPHNHNYHRFLCRMVFACDHRVKPCGRNCEDLPVSERDPRSGVAGSPEPVCRWSGSARWWRRRCASSDRTAGGRRGPPPATEGGVHAAPTRGEMRGHDARPPFSASGKSCPRISRVRLAGSVRGPTTTRMNGTATLCPAVGAVRERPGDGVRDTVGGRKGGRPAIGLRADAGFRPLQRKAVCMRGPRRNTGTRCPSPVHRICRIMSPYFASAWPWAGDDRMAGTCNVPLPAACQSCPSGPLCPSEACAGMPPGRPVGGWLSSRGGAREEAPLSSPAFGGMEGNTARSAVRNTHRADRYAECHILAAVSNEA